MVVVGFVFVFVFVAFVVFVVAVSVVVDCRCCCFCRCGEGGGGDVVGQVPPGYARRSGPPPPSRHQVLVAANSARARCHGASASPCVMGDPFSLPRGVGVATVCRMARGRRASENARVCVSVCGVCLCARVCVCVSMCVLCVW